MTLAGAARDSERIEHLPDEVGLLFGRLEGIVRPPQEVDPDRAVPLVLGDAQEVAEMPALKDHQFGGAHRPRV